MYKGTGCLLAITGEVRVNKFQAVISSEEEASPIDSSVKHVMCEPMLLLLLGDCLGSIVSR